MTAHLVSAHDSVTLGILAGGQATRLGGIDKAWLERDGKALVLALAERFDAHVDAVIVSANRNPERYLSHGLRAVHDRAADIGPLGGLDALAAACRSEWLLTVPVDAIGIPDDLVEVMLQQQTACYAEDDDGAQPLVALWRNADLHQLSPAAITGSDYAIHAIQSRLTMQPVRFDGVRFGNLNTAADLAAAGIAH